MPILLARDTAAWAGAGSPSGWMLADVATIRPRYASSNLSRGHS
ncbi:hypothetical protein SL1157_0957 [Ruegeria lacuscaerulensis ITI-1157]|nr:hypothetical protein SL1157_0957 [Ruegeria lacuscaerulensis ITI-1157]